MLTDSYMNSHSVGVISYEIKSWEYLEPEVYIDDSGELQLKYSGEKKQIGPITLLYQVVFDQNNKLLHSEPLDTANVYLMYQKIHNDAKCISLASRALKHFFSFIADENISRRQNGQPELLWNDMPIRKSDRATYRYKKCLKDCYNSEDPSINLARSTCNAYIRQIVSFYNHYIQRGWDFKEEPFRYEFVSIHIQTPHSSMEGLQKNEILTTDLRLNLGKDRRKKPNSLTALAPYQWAALEKILLVTRKVVSKRDGQLLQNRFPIEFSWILLLMRWTGLRREEVLTLRATLFYKPNINQLRRGYVEIDIGPSVGVDTKFDKYRTIEIPSKLMEGVFDYLQSARYIKRRDKHISWLTTHQKNFGNAFLFINENGEPYSLTTLNARWSDIRRTMEHPDFGLGEKFEHKLHNLRPTYAVERLINLLDFGIEEGKALQHIQENLGHENIITTLNYLRQAKDRRSGKRSPQEVWENVIDYHFEQGIFELKGD